MAELIRQIYSNTQFAYLVYVIMASLILGVAASVKNQDFKLVKLSGYLEKMLIPVMLGYGGAAILAYAVPDFGAIRDATYLALMGTLAGYIGGNIKDLFGIDIPQIIVDAIVNRKLPTILPPAAGS